MMLTVCPVHPGFCKWAHNWDLGVVQSIAGIMVVGFSVDYCLHLAHMYTEAPYDTARARVSVAFDSTRCARIIGLHVHVGISEELSHRFSEIMHAIATKGERIVGSRPIYKPNLTIESDPTRNATHPTGAVHAVQDGRHGAGRCYHDLRFRILPLWHTNNVSARHTHSLTSTDHNHHSTALSSSMHSDLVSASAAVLMIACASLEQDLSVNGMAHLHDHRHLHPLLTRVFHRRLHSLGTRR